MLLVLDDVTTQIMGTPDGGFALKWPDIMGGSLEVMIPYEKDTAEKLWRAIGERIGTIPQVMTATPAQAEEVAAQHARTQGFARPTS